MAKATIAATVPMPLTNMCGSDKFIRPLQQFCCMVKRDFWELREITGNYKRLLDTTRDYWKLWGDYSYRQVTDYVGFRQVGVRVSSTHCH